MRFLDLADRSESSHDTVNTIRERVNAIPGGKITIAMEEEGPPTGAPINLEISGPDFQVLGRIAREVRDALSLIPYVEDVRDDYPYNATCQYRHNMQYSYSEATYSMWNTCS